MSWRTVIVTISALLIGLMIYSQLFFSGVNPFISKLILILFISLLIIIAYLIYQEKNFKTKFIQIGLVLTCITISLFQLKHDLDELISRSDVRIYHQKELG
ncbi:MAG: hypothetical protein AAF985_21810, partial [Bacteroidota bacterium]